MAIEEIREKLRKYAALDNDLRLKAVFEVDDKPDISFNELSRKLKIERGLLGYHLGVLKAAGLVNVDYERRSKETSKYRLTEEGKKVLEELSRESKSNQYHTRRT
jgi:DNA-binding transcriptional ArsR family regulator